MFRRFFKVRVGEGRIILLLGSFFFLMLAATTIIGIAAETLFIAQLGASKLPYGILFGQVLIIPVFAVYGRLRGVVRAKWANPLIVFILVTLLLSLYGMFQYSAYWSAGALLVLVPCVAGILGSENGRLAATLLDARSARRLSPLIGTIGGLGASFGAALSGTLSETVGPPNLVLVATFFVAAVTVPAWFMSASMRPRGVKKKAAKMVIRKNRYVLMLIVAAGIVAAIATVLRTQLGAAAEEVYTEAQLGTFFSRLALAINLVSIVFTLLLSRGIINWLGAANSLLLYPVVLLITALVGVFAPTLAAITTAVFLDRLVRQNIHRTVSSVAIMPLNAQLRAKAALLISGSARPLGVIVSSLVMIFLVENIAQLPFSLDWRQLFWVVAVLSALILGALIYVRGRYIVELIAALHARRLQLDAEEDEPLPMDNNLKKLLLGYLKSDLPERCSLALQLLAEHVDDDVIDAIEQRWPTWEPWLRSEAVSVLASEPTESAKGFVTSLSENESDEIRATALRLSANTLNPDQLFQKAREESVHTRSEAIAELINRGETGDVHDLLSGYAQSENEADKRTAALAISKIESQNFDDLIPALLPFEPQALLSCIKRRPNPSFAPHCVPYLIGERTFVAARSALRAIGEDAVPTLKEMASETQYTSVLLELLATMDSDSSRQAIMELFAHQDRSLAYRALVARSQMSDDLNTEETEQVSQWCDQALDQAERYESYAKKQEGYLQEAATQEKHFALEQVFVALQTLNPEQPLRQLHLALDAFDSRQKALAIEALDEILSGKMRGRVLTLLEGAGDYPSEITDQGWLKLQSRLSEDQANQSQDFLPALQSSGLFRGWRLTQQTRLKPSDDASQPSIVIRNGTAIDPERVILTGKNPDLEPGDCLIPLRQVYRVMMQEPRCGALWLRNLAERVPDTGDGGGEITRSEMLSLATKTLSEDHDASESLDLWQRVFFLRTMSLTQALPSHRLRLVAEISRTLTASVGEVIVNEGRLGNHFYMVCTGNLQVSAKSKPLYTLGPSDSFGALALMRGERRAFTVTATEPSELLTIDRVDFLDLVEAHPSLVRSFSRMLANLILIARQNQDKDS